MLELGAELALLAELAELLGAAAAL